MEDQNKRIVEINGMKIEVDLRTAKRVDTYRVGDNVRLLMKRYGDQWEILPAVITGFADFKNNPGIEILYVTDNGDVQFKAITAETKETEIAPANELEIRLSKNIVMDRLTREIDRQQAALETAVARLETFKKFFGKFPE